MNNNFDFDLFVIGGGSGGVRAARRAAAAGLKVGLAESSHYGGTCVNAGCIPKKIFSYAADCAEILADSAGYGFTLPQRSFAWRRLMEGKNREISRLNSVYRKTLADHGVQSYDGEASFCDQHELLVAGERRRARHILIAVGGRPLRPNLPGGDALLTSNDMFHLPELPASLAVIGGGYIAVEFASIFSALGVKVTMIQRGDGLLTRFDHELSERLAAAFKKRGVRVLLKRQAVKISRQPEGVSLLLDDSSQIQASVVLAAIGRRPNTDRLQLDKAGVRVNERGAIVVDERFRTSTEHIFAIGDVSTRMQLTPVAIAEGEVVAAMLAGLERDPPNHQLTPTAVFSHPPLASVGLSERDARASGEDVDVHCSSFKPLRHVLGGRDEDSFVKIVASRASGRVLGLHMLGLDAPEIIQGFAAAMRAGIDWSTLQSVIGVHPTSAEEFVSMS